MNKLPLAKKSLGQHWLTDQTTLQNIVKTAGIGPEDVVLEIGPGTGTLTRELVKTAKQVVAVEFDRQLAEQLARQQFAKNLQTVRADILTFDLSMMPPGYKVVANIPYYLTSKLIRMFSETINPPAIMVLLVQKEVAERVAAGPGKMSLLSVSAQFYWEVSLGEVIPANRFTPPPKVDSQILVLKRRQKPLFKVPEKAFFRLIKAGFSNRRKTLLNSLSGGLGQGKGEIQAVLDQAAITPTTRPQALSLEQWHTLYKSAEAHKLI